MKTCRLCTTAPRSRPGSSCSLSPLDGATSMVPEAGSLQKPNTHFKDIVLLRSLPPLTNLSFPYRNCASMGALLCSLPTPPSCRRQDGGLATQHPTGGSSPSLDTSYWLPKPLKVSSGARSGCGCELRLRSQVMLERNDVSVSGAEGRGLTLREHSIAREN